MEEFQQAYPEQYERYLKACDAFNAGDYQAALEIYNSVFDPIDGKEAAIIDGGFKALIEMYKSDVLSALGRDQEAFENLNSPIVQVGMNTFQNQKYVVDYYLIHGDIAGRVGELEVMYDKIMLAIGHNPMPSLALRGQDKKMTIKGAQLMLDRYTEQEDDENIQFWTEFLQNAA